jgi:hypothetical protein
MHETHSKKIALTENDHCLSDKTAAATAKKHNIIIMKIIISKGEEIYKKHFLFVDIS